MTDEEQAQAQAQDPPVAASTVGGAAGAAEDSRAADETSTPEAEAEPAAVGAASGATPGEAPPERARLAELEARVSELERQLASEREAATDYMQRLQRTQADFSNFRRRAQQDDAQREAVANWRAMASMVPVLDSLERAFATLPPTLRTLSWIDGIALVHLQMSRALATMGISPVAAQPGAPFDPARHEAIGEVESDEHPEGAIAVVVQQGYEAAGMLVRPALVQTARPRRGAAAEPSQAGAASPVESEQASSPAGGEEAPGG